LFLKEDDRGTQKQYMPFDYINEENTRRLLGVFRKESPQVIALVLSYLKPDLVRGIYSELPADLQARVAEVWKTNEDQVRRVDADIKAKMDFLAGGVEGDAASYLAYGQKLYAEHKFDEAGPYFQYAAEADPQNAEAYQGLGHCFYSVGMIREAFQCYEAALQIAPGDEALKQWVEQLKQSSQSGGPFEGA
jgi:tetratricopeptide (TPR) repeat protein